MLEIVMLHNVKGGITNSIGPIADYAVTAEQLENLILERKKWLAISPNSLGSLSKSKRSFLLTFDDGYLDNLSTALPILEKHEIPCIIFCTTGFITGNVYPYEVELANVIEGHKNLILDDKKDEEYSIVKQTEKKVMYDKLRLPLKSKSFSDREELMNSLANMNNYNRSDYQHESFLSWNDVIQLNKHPLVTIGAHTVHHEQLAKQSAARAYKEMLESKKIIEGKIETEVNHFSYPYGSNGFFTRQLLRKAGFTYGFSTREGKVNKINIMNRVNLPRTDISNII